jgi:hypothetical protein
MTVIPGSRKHHYVVRASIFLITAALVWAMIGCDGTDGPTAYELTISSTGGGNVTIPGEGNFTCGEGTSHVLLATPDEGYRFVSWTGDVGTVVDVNDASTRIRMDGRYSITAEFEEIPEYDLTVSATDGGWVIKPGEGTFTRDGGTVVNLVAHEQVGYGFANWTGDVSTIADVNAASTTITMNGNYSITANFEEEEPVTITDSNLEAALRAAIGIPDRSIYPSDLKRLTSPLHAEQRNIADLTGLEYCTGLTSLYLYDNRIDDISPVANLTSLEYLDLSGNQIEDISPLASLTDLTHLNLSVNEIEDISPVASLTSLTQVNLSVNEIEDISPVASLTSLTQLNLSANEIEDISFLASLTSLTYLYLSSNQIEDISALASLTSLRDLSLGGNQIEDISALASLTSLRDLSLGDNQISGVSALANLASLDLLNLSDNQIVDIEPLVDNPGLTQGDKVYLSNNPLSSTSTDTYIPQLKARGVIVEY